MAGVKALLLIVLACAATASADNRRAYPRCWRAELNHVTTANFSQWVFWHADGNCIAWSFATPRDRLEPIDASHVLVVCKSNGWQIEADEVKETWTKYDVEVAERDVLRVDERQVWPGWRGP